MKLARVVNNRVSEIFDSENIEKKFNKKFVDELIRVDSSVSVNDYIFNGNKISAPENEEYILDNSGKWILPSDKAEEKNKEQDKKNKRKKIKDLLKKQTLTNEELQELIVTLVKYMDLDL